MVIKGVQELTLLDFPGHLAATLFLGGCDYRCPFCQNASLVERPGEGTFFSLEDVLAFLEARKSVLEGVCITGGEPLLNDLTDFIRQVRALGYLIKLDTNGNHPDRLKSLVAQGLIDYVAVDIKNSREHYARTNGVPGFQTASVEETVSFLMNGPLPFEFRTTVVKELHDEADFIKIGEWIRGNEPYFLQGFVDSGDLIKPGLHAYSTPDMLRFRDLVQPYVPNVQVRGID